MSHNFKTHLHFPLSPRHLVEGRQQCCRLVRCTNKNKKKIKKKRKEKAKVNKIRTLVGLISVKLHCFQLELTVAINKAIEMGKLLL